MPQTSGVLSQIEVVNRGSLERTAPFAVVAERSGG